MTTPTTPFDWATAALPADIVAPPSGVRLAGYGFEDNFDHDEFNYLLNSIGQWIGHLSKAGRVFNGAGDAEDSGLLAIGDVFTVQVGSPLGRGIMFEELISAPGTNDTVYVAGNGVYTIMPDGSVSTVVKDGFSVSSSAAPPGTLAACGPTHYATVLGSTVSLRTYPGSTAVWSYSHGGTILDVAVDTEHVYIVGASATNADGTGTHRAISIATGLEVWTQAWGATLKSVYATGSSVLVGGNSGTSTNPVGELDRYTGAEARTISLGGGATVSRNKTLYTDGVYMYVMSSSGLHVSPYSTNTAATAILSTGFMCADDTFIYLVLAASGSTVTILKKSDINAPPYTITPGGGGLALLDVYSDSRHLFVGYDVSAGSSWSMYRAATQPKRYVVKNDAPNTFLPTGSLYCPEIINY